MSYFKVTLEGKVPSVNRYWRHTKKGFHYVSPEGKLFKEKLAWLAAAERVEKIRKKPVGVSILWYCRKKCGGGDLDNRLKVILDALEGVVYENDSQVVKIFAEKILFAEKDAISVEVYPIDERED